MFASTVDLLAALSGLLAASIVVGGFLAHAHPAIRGESEPELRRAVSWPSPSRSSGFSHWDC